MNTPKFITDPTPSHFHGEDVIGDEFFGNRRDVSANRIPVQLLQKITIANQNNVMSQDHDPLVAYDDYSHSEVDVKDNYQDESITIKQPLNVSVSNSSQSKEVIVKTIKINLEIDLKINVV